MSPDVAEWRATEVAGQTLAAELHKAAAIDLARSTDLWAAIPTDGLVRELLASRVSSTVPSVHLSSAAGRLALLATLAEMGERAGSRDVRWRGSSLVCAAQVLGRQVTALFPGDLATLGGELENLDRVRQRLSTLDNADLARLAGRVLESAVSCYWIFASQRDEPERARHPWMAKQQGCFFTPSFIARHIARRAMPAEPAPVLDPAVGGGALLIECFLKLEPQVGPLDALRLLHGVDVDPAMVELTAIVLGFLAGQWTDSSPPPLREQIVRGDALLGRLEGHRSWHSWFPAVMEQGGFGAVVMNPPYGQLKVNQSTLPVRAGDSAKARDVRQRALAEARSRVSETARALREHPDYTHARGGVPDLPRFFMERALALLRRGGRLACIVPSTFLGDHRSREFRRHLLEDHALSELNLIPEDARLFQDVNQPTCVAVVKAGSGTTKIRVRRRVLSSRDLQMRPDLIITRRLIESVDPEERRVPDCAPADLPKLRQMHTHPRLGDISWVVNLRGELDLTIDAAFLSKGPSGPRLVRGDQIERYRDDLETDKDSWVHDAFLKERISISKARYVAKRRIVLRQCSYLKKPRRISATLVGSNLVVANSCNFLAVGDPVEAALDEESALLYLLGVLNSEILEWRFRTTSSTNHVGNYELAALPIPLPDGRPEVSKIIEGVEYLLRQPSDPEADRAVEQAVRMMYGLPEVIEP